MNLFVRSFVLLFLVSMASHAQSNALHRGKTFATTAIFGANDTVGGTATCDPRGSIYATVFDPAKPHEARPVLMFDPSGTLRAKFVSPHLRKLRGVLHPFAILPAGGIAIAEWDYPDIRVIKFAPDGKYETEFTIPAPGFRPKQLAVFPSGELLLSGITNGPIDRSFTAIYDSRGQLIKRLALPGEEEVNRAVELGDSRYAWGQGEGNRAVSHGRAITGDDGNVYLLRSTSPAMVYVISAKGGIVRTIVVEPTKTGDQPLEMQLSKGKLAFVFDAWLGERSAGNPTLVVVDVGNGQKMRDFESGGGVGLFGLACYQGDADTFTFLGMSSSRHIEIITAK